MLRDCCFLRHTYRTSVDQHKQRYGSDSFYKKIKYIYLANKGNSNQTINNLISTTGVQGVSINTMYSIDGGITTTNDDYLTIMKSNINLIEQELYKDTPSVEALTQ